MLMSMPNVMVSGPLRKQWKGDGVEVRQQSRHLPLSIKNISSEGA